MIVRVVCGGWSERVAHLLFCVNEEFTDVLFGGTDEFVQNLGTVHDLGLPCVEHFPDLTRHERLTGAGRSMKKYT